MDIKPFHIKKGHGGTPHPGVYAASDVFFAVSVRLCLYHIFGFLIKWMGLKETSHAIL
jgi:hypothetical protein